MIKFPNCKINLGLRVLRKRSDGFHDVETIMFPVDMNDVLEIIPSTDGESVYKDTGLGISGDQKNNLVVRAYEIMKKQYNLPPVHIHLHKAVPMGAGLGGGSADAAYAIKMLNELFNLNLTNEILEDHASQLGSDCAFFIRNQPMLASGKGDQLSPVKINFSGYKLVLVKPEIHIPTAEAYSWIIPNQKGQSLKEIINKPVEEWKGLLQNDFETEVFKRHPEIALLKNKLYKMGASYAALTGSGAAVYGLFKNESDVSLDFEGCFVFNSFL